jgi:hypothetical protein
VEKFCIPGQKENRACVLQAGYVRLQANSEYVIRIAFKLQQATQLSFTLYEQYTASLFSCVIGLLQFISNYIHEQFNEFQRNSKTCQFFFNTCIVLATNLRDFWKYVIWRFDYISETINQDCESDGWVFVNVVCFLLGCFPACGV